MVYAIRIVENSQYIMNTYIFHIVYNFYKLCYFSWKLGLLASKVGNTDSHSHIDFWNVAFLSKAP